MDTSQLNLEILLDVYFHCTDLLEKSQGTAEIKFRECLKKRGQSFAGLWARDHDIIIIMIFGIFSSLGTDFDTHDLWDEMNEIKEALAREGLREYSSIVNCHILVNRRQASHNC